LFLQAPSKSNVGREYQQNEEDPKGLKARYEQGGLPAAVSVGFQASGVARTSHSSSAEIRDQPFRGRRKVQER
jgi:hypothetical protein